MRPLTISDAASMVIGLQREIRRSEELRYDHRLHGVLLGPELNPIERVWRLTRGSACTNRYFGFLESVVEAVENRFAEWAYPIDTLRRLCAIT